MGFVWFWLVAVMIVGLLWLGLYPQPVINTFSQSLDNLQRVTQLPAVALRR